MLNKIGTNMTYLIVGGMKTTSLIHSSLMFEKADFFEGKVILKILSTNNIEEAHKLYETYIKENE